MGKLNQLMFKYNDLLVEVLNVRLEILRVLTRIPDLESSDNISILEDRDRKVIKKIFFFEISEEDLEADELSIGDLIRML